MQRERTSDGTETLISDLYGEPFHSITAGAFTEAIEKFCKPCKVEEVARSSKSLNLLDVCFGLGYNTVAFVQTAISVNPRLRISVVGVEKDPRVIEKSLSLDWGKFGKWKFILRELLKRRIFVHGLPAFVFTCKNMEIKVFVGEARRVFKRILKFYENFADFVFHDPFSPKVNPELWTVEFFKVLKKMMKEKGCLATYSSSSSVRKALIRAGFGVVEGVALGRKTASTVASLKFSTSKSLLEKLERSKVPPLRDPSLSESPEKIKERFNYCKKLSCDIPEEI